MKKVSILFTAIAFMAVGVFTSCEEEGSMAPIITFDDASYTAGAGGAITITGEIESEAGLDEVRVFEVNDAGDETQLEVVTSFNGLPITEGADGLTYAFRFDLNVSDGTVQVKMRATDKDDQETSKTVSVTGASAGAISSFTAVLMGAQDNASTGSALDASAGDVYTLANANSNSALIDMIYYYGATNTATLAAPDDATVNGGSGNLTLATGYTTKNPTRFNASPGVTASEFDAATDDSEIAGLSGLSASIITSLSQNDVIGFETADGKLGLIKVTAITAGATGSMTITVKIQE